MGLSIHYGGHLKNANSLPHLIEEVKDVAIASDWKYQIFETVFVGDEFSHEPSYSEIYGISFTPTNCETISITFLSNCAMVCPMRLSFMGNSEETEGREWIYTTSVKTQYAGVKIHQFIILLFRYLNEKYFDDFRLSDESAYWETNDEEEMKTQFRNYEALLDNFALAIETFPVLENENMLIYFERLMKRVNDLKK